VEHPNASVVVCDANALVERFARFHNLLTLRSALAKKLASMLAPRGLIVPNYQLDARLCEARSR
jgi:hypothetical protein